jgi:hypothetical protein
MIDPGTAQRSPNAGHSPEKLRLRHLAARANPRSGPFGLAWRAGTEQGRLRNPASGESRRRIPANTHALGEAIMCPPDTEVTDSEQAAALAAALALAGDVATTTHANATSAATISHGTPEQTRYLVPGIDSFLGHGYDVFGEYASPNSVKARIYDLPSEPRVDQPTVDESMPLSPEQLSHAFTVPPSEIRLIYSRPERVGYTDVFQSSIEVNEITTSDKEKIKWGIGGEIEGGYGGFSGEITGRFDTKNTRLATTHCIQATFKTIYWKLDVNNYSYSNAPPIADDVKQDFITRPVDRLMEKYGTHCLEEIGIGTKIVHSYTIDTSKFSRSMDVTAALKAKYEAGTFNAGMTVNSEYHDAAWNDRSAVSVKIFTYGTSDNQLAEITDLSEGLSKHPLAVLKQGWHNPTLIQFYKSSLRPLWEIEGLMLAEKAAEFAARFRARAQAEQVQLDLLFQRLQPVYLMSLGDGVHKKYRMERSPHYKSNGKDWTIENDGQPWLFLSAEQRDGMVPLYELALNDDIETVRYETEGWSQFLTNLVEGYSWSKTGRVLGYVYANEGMDQSPPADAVPVYTYYDKDGLASRGIFYSFLKNLVWDKGQWKLLTEESIAEPELRRAAQARLDREWDSHDGWYKFWHVKPTLAEVGFALDPDKPNTLKLVSLGIPHWYSVKNA